MKNILYILLFAIFFSACKKNDNDSDNNNGCPVNIEIQETFDDLPHRVAVFFKAEDCNGLPLADLTKDDFDLFENTNNISSFEADARIIPNKQIFAYNTLLLLDLSGSILESDNLDVLKEASRSFIDRVLPSETTDPNFEAIKMEIWWFDGSTAIHQLVAPSSNPTLLKAGITAITPNISSDNSTNLHGAIIQGAEKVRTRLQQYLNADSINIAATSLVLFTDGTDQASRETEEEARNAIANAPSDISFYAIGLGGEIDKEMLQTIGRNGFVETIDITNLTGKFNEIAKLVRDEANSHYYLGYCSPKRAGQHEITIRIKGRSGEGIANFDASDFVGGDCPL